MINLIIWIVVLVIVFLIVRYILSEAGAPPIYFTVLNIVGALILLLLVLQAFGVVGGYPITVLR